MIDQYVTEYPGSFEEFDVKEIRSEVGELDGKITKLFQALINREDSVSDPHQEVQNMIDNIRKKYGENAGNFYDAIYGCALNERMNLVMENPVLK